MALTLAACTGNPPNDNSNNQISKGDNANTDNNLGDTNQDKIPGDINQDTNTDSNVNNPGNTSNIAYEDIKLTPEEVFNIFVKKYPDVKVNKLGLDFDRGSYVYEVEGYNDTNKYELKIKPADGKGQSAILAGVISVEFIGVPGGVVLNQI